MFLRRVRRTGRVLAVALLVWTAIDLLDRRFCESAPGQLQAASAQAVLQPTFQGDGTGQCDRDHPAPGHAGDCFCCSAFVDVRFPFALEVGSTAMWLEPASTPRYCSIPAQHTHRPPILGQA